MVIRELSPEMLPTGEHEVLRGQLASGRLWHVVHSHKKNSRIVEGEHLILEGVGSPVPHDPGSTEENMLTQEEDNELCLLAPELAQRLSSRPGFNPKAWRTIRNGPECSTAKHWHTHILLPKGSDRLARVVD